MKVNYKIAEYISESTLVDFSKVLKSTGVFNAYNKFHDSVNCLILINGQVVENFELYYFDNLVVYLLANEVKLDDLKHNSNLSSLFGNFDKVSFNRNTFFNCPRGPVCHVNGDLFDYYDYFKLKTPRIGWNHYNINKLFNTEYTSKYKLKHDIYTAICTCLYHNRSATLDEVLKFAKDNNITNEVIESLVNSAHEFIRK